MLSFLLIGAHCSQVKMSSRRMLFNCVQDVDCRSKRGCGVKPQTRTVTPGRVDCLRERSECALVVVEADFTYINPAERRSWILDAGAASIQHKGFPGASSLSPSYDYYTRSKIDLTWPLRSLCLLQADFIATPGLRCRCELTSA